MMSTEIPFIHGRAVSYRELCGRRKELKKLTSRLRTGQSTAIVGLPRVGKTSLLSSLQDSEAASTLGKEPIAYTFSYLDAQALRGCKTQADFWELALAPLQRQLSAQDARLTRSTGSYSVAQSNGFGTAVLEQFFTSLDREGSRLVLLLDEFDDFLVHPVLNSAEFYGGLRSLASLNPGFAIVIGTRKTPEQLNVLTQQINPHGSPYFNIFTEIHLGVLSENELRDLLARGERRFSPHDYRYLTAISGRHPYLAQVGAALLWEAYEENVPVADRYRHVGRGLYRETSKHFADCWRMWPNEVKKVLTVIALEQIPQLVRPHPLLVSELAKDFSDYAPELEALETSGIVQRQSDGSWQIQQACFIWWMSNELLRSIRSESEFTQWLRAQEIDGLLTNEEKTKLGSAAKALSGLLKNGVTAMIEAFSKGFGEALAKAE